MKKFTLPLIIIFTLSALSCKKKYTCKCYLKVPYKGGLVIYNKDTIKFHRKAADKHCAAYDIKTPANPDSLYCYAYTDQ